MGRPLASQPTAEGLRAFYNLVYREQGFKLPAHMWPVCMALADQRIKKLMLVCPPGTGKSLLLSVVYPAWRLGIDRQEQIIAVSAGEDLVKGFTETAAHIIESTTYGALFPLTRPDKAKSWAGSSGFCVTGKPNTPDSSYIGCGIESRALTGLHCTHMIMDDIHNNANSNTAESCEKITKMYYNTIVGRADPMGCRFIIAGRRWHVNDIYGDLANSDEYVVMTLPAERPNTNECWMDVLVPDGLKCVFTE